MPQRFSPDHRKKIALRKNDALKQKVMVISETLLYCSESVFQNFLYLLGFLKVIFTWPKNLYLWSGIIFTHNMCLCVCLSVSVSLYPDYLKKFLTDFDEILQDDVIW